jgi:ribosome-associated protein
MAIMADDLQITESVAIPLDEIELAAVRSAGPGGQNVNKVSSAIHLRFDIATNRTLPEKTRRRLLALDDRRISSSGVIVIKAQEHRNQARNREAALSRLKELVLDALAEEKVRLPTKPGRKAIRKRVDDKRRRGQLKQTRSRIDED